MIHRLLCSLSCTLLPNQIHELMHTLIHRNHKEIRGAQKRELDRPSQAGFYEHGMNFQLIKSRNI
jgi:hypothetical protein